MKAVHFLIQCAAMLALCAAQAHESPVDHVERELELTVKDGQLCLGYRLHFTDRALIMQLLAMDTNNDGHLTDAERTAYFTDFAGKLADLFSVQVDGKPLKFKPIGAMRPDGRLGQTYDFCAPLGTLPPGRHLGVLLDGYSRQYPGPFRWHPEEAAPGIHVEPLDQPVADPTQHPAWLELKFAIVVPE